MGRVDKMFDDKAKGSWHRVLCVDPGIGGTGLAYWQILSKPKRKAVHPDLTQLINVTGKQSWEEKIDIIVEQFASVLQVYNPQHVLLEFQELWTGSSQSMASASSGALFKLTYLTGQLGREVRIRTKNRAVLVSPGTWKGQLHKKAVSFRVKRALKIKRAFPNHVGDAVGIGIAMQGKL